jgi:hypothetical protein
MGLSAGFKQYIADHFPECYAKSEQTVQADVLVVDAMVTLHRFKPDPDSDAPSAHQLADLLFFTLWNARVAAICFDDVHTTTRAKEAEWAARSLSTGACDPVQLEALLADHRLPEDLNDFFADRFLRQRLNTYLRDELFRRVRISRGMTPMRLLAVFNAGGPPQVAYWPADGMSPFAESELIIESHPDWDAPLNGEGETCCVRAAGLLRSSAPGTTPRVVVSTCDTDTVLIGMLNGFPQLIVELSHYDRKTHAPSFATIDVHQLGELVQSRLRISPHDFSVISISKGSDFVQQSVAGIADWHKYVQACCNHLRAKGPVMTVSASGATVDIARADAMFRSLETLGKRVAPKYVTARHLHRLAWNAAYFALCAGGKGGALERLEQYGWRIVDGVMRPDERPATVASTPRITIPLN